jgi:chromatin remodeling complex protein RSC6
MAIAPIDLQAIFSQVDKVGKTQAAQREGQTLHQAIQGVQLQRKTEENIQQVNEAQNTGEGAEKVKDRDSRQEQKHKSGGKSNESKKDENEEETQAPALRDPYLGRKVDISL